jgi:4-oxalocrotonate tautomerase family enzyme
MPWVTINLMKGHSKAQKKKLHETVTKAVAGSLELPLEYVRIQLVEMTPENHSIAGKMRK